MTSATGEDITRGRAWTMTVRKNEDARDASAVSLVHRAAVRSSGAAAQAMKFVSLTVPASEVPMS
jgi:hypothetical protein